MDALAFALAAAALVAGLTGTWSPCGFSMIETLGRGHRGGLPTTIAACLTFTAGALVGGVITFGSLSLLGGLLHGADDRAAYLVAAVVALAAAILEARGTPIVPQVRRQLPEPWRRQLAMPLAAAGYGVLLGLGFTTFVLTFGVFALAGVSLAVGEPAVGLVVGLGFGVGRALPVAFTAPVAERPAGIRVTELMAERPALYRGFRLGDALALTVAAAALALTVPAGAATVERQQAADPAADGDLAFQVPPDRAGILRRGGGQEVSLPGAHPAIGGGKVALVDGDEIVVRRATNLAQLGRYGAPGVNAVAVSDHWLAWRQAEGKDDLLLARRITDPGDPGPAITLASALGEEQIGLPSLDGERLVYAKATGAENKIIKRNLGSGEKTTSRRSIVHGLSNPSVNKRSLLYVRHERERDRLVLKRGGGGERVLLSRRKGMLWSTALERDRAYVTVIKGTTPSQRIISIHR